MPIHDVKASSAHKGRLLWIASTTDGVGQALALTVQMLPGTVVKEQGDLKTMLDATAKRRPEDVVSVRATKWKDLDLAAVDLEHDSPRGGRVF